ncbi:MAG: fimbria/pilus periplasmic chaperone [Pseudomonadota bacterium]
MICCLPDARSRLRAWLAVALLCLPALAPEAALAGQIRLSPLSLSLTPDQRATTVTLRNETQSAVSVQVRVFSWQQDANAGMLLSPTSDIALSPAMITLPPGATQLVRVVLRHQGNRGEQYYRVLIDELPSAASASRDRIQVLTRYSLPLFLEPRVAGLPKLSLHVQSCQDGRQRLLIANTGERRARLANWLIVNGEQTLASQDGLAGYVLPGSSLALAPGADLAWPAAGATLRADTDLGPWQADIPSPGEPTSCPPAAAPL